MGEAGFQAEARVRGVRGGGGRGQARDGEGTKLVSLWLPHLPPTTVMSVNEFSYSREDSGSRSESHHQQCSAARRAALESSK